MVWHYYSWGSYHVEDINELIQREMRKNRHYDKANDKCYIEISANTNTLKPYTSGFHESENMIKVTKVKYGYGYYQQHTRQLYYFR